MRKVTFLLIIAFCLFGFSCTGNKPVVSPESKKKHETPVEIPMKKGLHQPVCKHQGTPDEGWYWEDTGVRIVAVECAGLKKPWCSHIGTDNEGWYTEGGQRIIVNDKCHRTARISVEGESCGGSIGYRCLGGLYCRGLPSRPGMIGGAGTCRPNGYCETAKDCDADGNIWSKPRCVGHAVCDTGDHLCGWICGDA